MVAHPLPVSSFPQWRGLLVLQILGQLVALRVRFPSAVYRITDQDSWPCVEQTRAVSYETGDCDENAALADDHSLTFGFEVPKIRQGQCHKGSGGHSGVGALRLSTDAIKGSIDHDPVQARIGTSSDRGMADGGNCR